MHSKFINCLLIGRFSCSYNGPEFVETTPDVSDSQKRHYPIFHDETCVHANDLDNYVWMREGEQPL